ncbi:MAG: hypothetical protein ACR2FU_05095, partial [Streptosporangiaceae bacterium]
MNSLLDLDRFLQTDPRDVGCEQALEILHVYMDLVAASGDTPQRFPRVVAHPRDCGTCRTEF